MNFSTGNSWDPKIITMCQECGLGKICDTCHRHGYPRGKCEVCPSEKPHGTASQQAR